MINNYTPKHYFLDLEVDRVTEMEGEPSPCITQIAILDPSRKKEKNIFNRYIQPPKELSNKPLKEAPNKQKRYSFGEVWPDAVTWINKKLDGNRKAIIVMHNGFKHDWPILQTEVARAMRVSNVAIPNFWKPFDTLWLKNTLQIPGEGSLTMLCHSLKVPVGQAHDAAEDVKMTQGIFDRMVGSAPLDQVLVAALDQHPIKESASVIKAFNKELIKLKDSKFVAIKKDQVVNVKDAKVVFLVVDYESTGLFGNGPNPRAVQVAVYIPSDKDETKEIILDELINPEMAIPRGSSAVHGIFDQDVKEAKTFKAVWLKLNEQIDSKLESVAHSVAVLVGHNYWGFDSKLHQAESERTGLSKRNWKSFDTLYLARNRFKGIKDIPRKGFFKQEYLAPLLGINFSGAHDAKNDVLATWGLFKAFTEGVNASKRDQAILSAHPVLTLGQLCEDEGDFDAHFYFGLYKKACGLTVDFAKTLFCTIKNPSFFEPSNLAATLGVYAESNDPELYILWRCFLVLSEGVDRKLINQALENKDPLDAIVALCKESSSFNPDDCKAKTKMACELVVPLSMALFPEENELFYEPKAIASLFGMSMNGAITIFDLKRMFLKMTQGIPSSNLEKACQSEESAKAISALVLEKGKFNPADYVEVKLVKQPNNNNSNSIDNFFSNSVMDVEVIKNQDSHLKRKAEDELSREDASLDKKSKK